MISSVFWSAKVAVEEVFSWGNIQADLKSAASVYEK